MISRLFALFIWASLLNPAIHIGKTWQSSIYPGPTVDVSIGDNIVRGHMSYALDGKQSVIDESDVQHLLGEHSVISSTTEGYSNRSLSEIIATSWPALTPLITITALLLLFMWKSIPVKYRKK